LIEVTAEEKPKAIRTLAQITEEYDQHLRERLSKMTPKAAAAERRRLDNIQVKFIGRPLHDPDPELSAMKDQLAILEERAGIRIIEQRTAKPNALTSKAVKR
jgi:hypothetical protein